MTIDKNSLNQLDDEAIAFSGTFLENIFLNRQTDIMLNKQEVSAVLQLIKSVSGFGMKSVILSHVNRDAQFALVQIMDTQELAAFFSYFKDLSVLQPVFKNLERNNQLSILKRLSSEDRVKFTALKELVKDDISLKQETEALKTAALKQFIEKEKKALLTLIHDVNSGINNAKAYGEKLAENAHSDDLEPFGKAAIHSFMALGIPLADKAAFSMHLKFYYFLGPLLEKAPSIDSHLAPLIDNAIMTLNRLPNGEWVVKVLSQFPLNILKKIMARLLAYEKIANFEKRNMYCKLLNDIKNHSDLKEAEPIRFVFSQL